ncbi:MAG: TRASH domain-containing protein [Saprospiraceae bacterium]
MLIVKSHKELSSNSIIIKIQPRNYYFCCSQAKQFKINVYNYTLCF